MKMLRYGLTIMLISFSVAANAQELMGRLENRMGELSERQAVISKNIANANTPNYVAEDIQLSNDTKPRRQRLTMARTNGMHMNGKEEVKHSRFIKDEYAEKSPDGNQVDIVHETDKASRTSMDYELTTSLYKQMASMLKKAAGGQ